MKDRPPANPVAQLSAEEVVTELIARKGTQTIEQLARTIGVSFQYLARVLVGQRLPGQKVLDWMGMKKVTKTWYERITKQ